MGEYETIHQIEEDDLDETIPLGPFMDDPGCGISQDGSDSSSDLELQLPLCLTSKSRTAVILDRLSQALWTLAPSPLIPDAYRGDVPVPVKNGTSYLNGLRGLAAVIVFVRHAVIHFFLFIQIGYDGAPTPDQPPGYENHHLIQMPIVRVIIAGRFMVAIFFILSGFVLSYGPLKRVHSGQADQAVVGLSSSLLRRPVRLFLPVLPVLLVSNFLTYCWEFYRDGSTPIRWAPDPEGFVAQMWGGFMAWIRMMNPFVSNTPPLMPQCWTLPMEFRGSITIFCMVLALANVRYRWRAIISVVFGVYCLEYGLWEAFLFVCGAILADFRLEVQDWKPCHPRIRFAVQVAAWIGLVLSLFLGGWPNIHASTSWGFSAFTPLTLSTYKTSEIQEESFWISVSSAILLLSIEQLKPVQRLLNSSVVLYLGEISFGLYLVHWAVLYTIHRHVLFTLTANGWAVNSAWTVCFCMSSLISWWVADLHWRFVDQKCVSLSKTIVKRLTAI
jgi:peptidoglycan/LPS O-acetylase OafA/YrhL